MLDQRIMELINADIDGVLGQQERRELQSVLDASPEAVTFRLELLELNNAFHNLPELDPPPTLARDILAQIELPARRKLFDFVGFLAELNPAAAGLAFAAGLLLTVGFYEMGTRNVTQQDIVNMVGTMVAGDQVKIPIEGDGAPDQGGRLVLDLEGLSGTVSLNVSENGQALEFDLDSSQVIEIELGLEQAGLVVSGFAQDDRGDGTFIDTLELAGGTMRVVNQGKHHFVVFLRPTPGTDGQGKKINIGISRGGERVYENTLGSWR